MRYLICIPGKVSTVVQASPNKLMGIEDELEASLRFGRFSTYVKLWWPIHATCLQGQLRLDQMWQLPTQMEVLAMGLTPADKPAHLNLGGWTASHGICTITVQFRCVHFKVDIMHAGCAHTRPHTHLYTRREHCGRRADMNLMHTYTQD
jgi:hypothetical protein